MVEQIAPTEVVARIENGALLLDVREQHEWDAGHGADATHVPLGTLPSQLDELPRDQQIVAVCRSGTRSDQAAGFLVERGFNAVNLSGGMHAWNHAGLPIIDSSGGPGDVA